MAVESGELTGLSDEFALVEQTAAEAGVVGDGLPRVRRAWVNVPTGGHVSAVFWGKGQPEVVFLHDIAESARAWDAVALALGRPSVAIDLPGHGRSDWRRDGRYESGKLASAIGEAIRSFAPRARLIVGSGLGGRTALALRRRQRRLVPRLVLLRTLPGAEPGAAQEWPGPERFASPADALTVLEVRRQERSARSLRREIQYELGQDEDGSWAWRHHPGNLPIPAAGSGDAGAAEEALWEELALLGSGAVLIRGGRAEPLAAPSLGWLRERAPEARLITISDAGTDVVGAQPGALAAALDQLVQAEEQP
jgi:pimeloyl-ACP methyl ester carboxylesterase